MRKRVLVWALIMAMLLTIFPQAVFAGDADPAPAAVTEDGSGQETDPADPTVTPDPADPTVTPDPADPTVTPDPADPTVTPDPADPTVTPDPADPTVTPDPADPAEPTDPAVVPEEPGDGTEETDPEADVPEEEDEEEEEEEELLETMATEVIEDGYYTIQSALGNVALDIAGSSVTNGGNVQIYRKNGSAAQTFRLVGKKISAEKTVYKIYLSHAVSTDMALDVTGKKRANGTNIQIWTASNTPAQQWYLTKDSSGYYTIHSNLSDEANDFVLDVRSKKTDNGTNVQLYTSTGSKAQKWILTKVEKPAVADTAYDAKGVYFIVPKLNPDVAIDVKSGSLANGGATQLYTKNGSNAQRFIITTTSDGYANIKAVHSGKLLNVRGSKAVNSAVIQQYADTGASALKWKIVPTGDGDGSVFIQFYKYNYRLDVKGKKAVKGGTVQLYENKNTDAQKFFLVKTTYKTGWGNFLGKYRYVYDKQGHYYTNCKVGNENVGADGVPLARWEWSGGYYRYRLSNGKYATDVRPYLTALFGATTVGGQTAPNCLYFMNVDRFRCVATIYTRAPGTSSWNLPVFAFKISPGQDVTPTTPGYHTAKTKARWHQLNGPSYGQYCTLVTASGIWLHSIPCDEMNDHNVWTPMYNLLGNKASHGCIRMNVRNAYWTYTFCQNGMTIHVGDALNDPIPPIPQPKMNGGGIDPTDPAYTGNYGYAENGKYYGRYYF